MATGVSEGPASSGWGVATAVASDYTAFALEKDEEEETEHGAQGTPKREDSFATLEQLILQTLQQTDATTSPVPDVYHQLEHLAATTHAPAPQADQVITVPCCCRCALPPLILLFWGWGAGRSSA